MPSKSRKQQKLMCAAVNDAKVRKRLGVTKKEAEDFCKNRKSKKK